MSIATTRGLTIRIKVDPETGNPTEIEFFIGGRRIESAPEALRIQQKVLGPGDPDTAQVKIHDARARIAGRRLRGEDRLAGKGLDDFAREREPPALGLCPRSNFPSPQKSHARRSDELIAG